MDSSWCEPWQWRFLAKTITPLGAGQIPYLDKSTNNGDSCVCQRIACLAKIRFPARTSRSSRLRCSRLIFGLRCRRQPARWFWHWCEFAQTRFVEPASIRQPEVDEWGTRLTSDRATGARSATAMDRSDVAANPQVFRLLATVARALASNDNASNPGIGSCDAPSTIERVCISIATARRASASK